MGSHYFLGLCVSLFGHSISALGINLQKYAHMQGSDGPLYKKPSWIFGLVCMAACEAINFVALSLVPASVVAPLGSFSVVCSAFFGRFFFGESIDRKSILGILLIVVGTTLVVLTGPSGSEDMSVDKFKAILAATKSKVYIACDIAILITLFSFGNNSFLGTLGLAAVSAGNTITLTKAMSMFVAMSITGENQLRNFLPYLILILVVGSVFVQIQKLNKAMERYPSYICTALQFVILTTVTIINSTVLFDEMVDMTPSMTIAFITGCLIVMTGVYFLVSGPKTNSQTDSEDREHLLVMEEEEETY